MSETQVIFIGGRSGVGKSSAAAALFEMLSERKIRHALIEGDNLDLAFPAPHVVFPDFKLAERNLHAVWANYKELGYSRVVYTNTASVLHVDELVRALGGAPQVTAVLLEATDVSIQERLARRSSGIVSALELQHSAMTGVHLSGAVDADVHRIKTDGLTPQEVAAKLLELTGWHDVTSGRLSSAS